MKQQKESRENISDELLVNDFKYGSMRAYHELVSRYTYKIYNLAQRITRNPEDAEEVLQDVFFTLYCKINTFEGKSSFSSWIYRITTNSALMKLRKSKKNLLFHSFEQLYLTAANNDSYAREKAHNFPEPSISSEECFELKGFIEKAIQLLPNEYRSIFVLRDIDGLSNQEVGEVLNLPLSTIKSRLHRSRLFMRKKLNIFYKEHIEPDFLIRGIICWSCDTEFLEDKKIPFCKTAA
jgi:RNA polymerase sigma-70 factor, ECF subfamily